MKILALYGSRFGQAETILRRVVRRLQSSGHSVTMVQGDSIPDRLSLSDFDAVVVAASIIMGRYQSYVRRWVHSNVAALNAMPSAFISVNGTPPEPTPQWRAEAHAYVKKLTSETGWSPRWIATFAGALRYSRYGPITRWIMKRISRSQGGPTDTSRDYDFTDWEGVDRFAESLGERLAESAPHEPVPAGA
jgi:menaquinone-dependent protoporphyrinogen oxidase